MKKVFLVDDEKMIREGVSKSIDWEENGFSYCGDACDGEMALPLIEREKPDIVITDIQMPFMNGLELSGIIRKNMPWIKIIILSGYDEFEYARKALSLQVSEYCLKPVGARDLLGVLKKVSNQIDKEKNKINPEQYSFIGDSKLKDIFMFKLCKGVYSKAEAIVEAKKHGIDIISNYYQIIVVDSDKAEDLRILIMTGNINCFVFNKDKKETIFFLKGDSREELEKESADLYQILKKEPDSLTYGFGFIKNRIEDIYDSLREASKEKDLLIRIGQKYQVENSELDLNGNQDVHHFNRKELIDFIKNGEEEKMAEFCESYSAYLKKDEYHHSPFYTYYFLMDFTITITHYMKELESDTLSTLQEIRKLELKTSLITDYPEILAYMIDMLNIVFRFRSESKDNSSLLFHNVKNYIHLNYHNADLSLTSIASAVSISPAYLSHLFSKANGQTIIEYITNTRIERAKELLKTTIYKTYEIAYSVGYNDSQYFCHTFKKATGMTTREYRQRYKGQKQA